MAGVKRRYKTVVTTDKRRRVMVPVPFDPDAGAFFDSLAQFYRRAYLRWIDATKKRPDVRAERIAEVVRLLEQGQKERP